MLVPSLQAWLQVSQKLVFIPVGYTVLDCSLRTLYRKCERLDPLLMVLKSTNDAVRLHTLLTMIPVSRVGIAVAGVWCLHCWITDRETP